MITHCITIPLQTYERNQDKTTTRLPIFSLITVFLDINNVGIAAVTETWFRKEIGDELVSLAKT